MCLTEASTATPNNTISAAYSNDVNWYGDFMSDWATDDRKNGKLFTTSKVNSNQDGKRLRSCSSHALPPLGYQLVVCAYIPICAAVQRIVMD